MAESGKHKRGKYNCTIDLLFDGLVSAVLQLTIFVFIFKTD
jgi:hypothetical protein